MSNGDKTLITVATYNELENLPRWWRRFSATPRLPTCW